MHSTGQSSEIRLSLVPETLGDVSVKLTVDAGNVSAHVIADTPEVRDAIVSAQPELSRSLADAGLKLTSFTVDVSGGGFAGFAQQQNDGSQTGQRSNRGTNAIDSDDDEDMAVDAVPTFGPPIDAVRNPGDLNHLA
jgi:flagellar hook-length control protein FliK